MLKTTPLGRRIRATVQNRQLAECSGISTRATDRLDLLHRLRPGRDRRGGADPAARRSTPPSAQSYIINAFLVVVVGGIGQIKGAVIAAFVLGIGQAALEYVTDASIAPGS